MKSEEFTALAATLRPELHRYCARLMGSVLDGEDVVQDTFANATAALAGLDPETPLKAWLFRIAHNRAIDLLRQKEVRMADSLDSRLVDVTGVDPEEAVMREQATATAVSRFVELPVLQRSVVVLKDVLGQSLAEISTLLSISIDAVKGHLARGRASLHDVRSAVSAHVIPPRASADVARYVDLFNRRDWDGLRAMLADDVQLVQSTHPRHSGREEVGQFFTIYARSMPVRLAPAWLEDREVIAVYEGDTGKHPDYVMRIETRDGRITFIRDYRYVRYVVDGVEIIETSFR